MSILIIIALVIAVVFIIRKSRLKGKSIETQDLSGFKSEGYWNNFKRRQPQNAIEIEEICKRNMNSISDRDAFELVTSILRWSKNANTPICKLKEWFLQNLKKQDTDIPLAQYIEILKEEKLKEAKHFSISPDHTICNIMLESLLEEAQEKNSDKELNRIESHLGLSEVFIEDVKNQCDESNIAPDIS